MNSFTTNIQLVYIVAAACFVIGLHLMNSPATARRGNQVSTAGMGIAVIATLILLIHAGSVTGVGWTVIIVGALLGSAAGGVLASGAGLTTAYAAFAAVLVLAALAATRSAPKPAPVEVPA